MIGLKLAWTGLTLVVITPVFGLTNIFAMAGAVVMIVGVILFWLDK